MRKFLVWLLRAALFVVGFMAFVVVIGESAESVAPWSAFALKIASLGVVVACCKAWWWSLSPAEKAEIEKEEV